MTFSYRYRYFDGNPNDLPHPDTDWKKFVKPHELAAGLRHAGLNVTDITGVSYDPLGDRWRIGRDTDVNYMMVAGKV